ncbi:MAG: hypothetical protein RMK52_09325 [Chitinophagales bacterium]|nr:hypothetical protein [Chitinophagales bacterium]MDW8394425.1 hypothetical protein [Chitinophagales bacterium]
MKTLAIPALFVAAVLALSGCQPVDNSKAIARADSIGNARIKALTDSVMQACMSEIMAIAQHRADSLMAAAMKKPGVKKPAPPAPKKEDPKKGTVADRPGTQQQGPQTVTDRPGTQQEGPKSVTDRKGATQQQQPPK